MGAARFRSLHTAFPCSFLCYKFPVLYHQANLPFALCEPLLLRIFWNFKSQAKTAQSPYHSPVVI